jgi:hypothetical protein
MNQIIFFALVTLFANLGLAAPAAPTDPSHPGSKSYTYTFEKKVLKCQGRDVTVFAPAATVANETFPVVVYGHGQALNLEHYTDTFEHLAKKGVAVIFPMYDKGFFDQEWQRMGRDYVTLTDCALSQFQQMARDQVVFSGHSKGAYVASIAAGLAFKENLAVRPKAAVVFETAGFDASSAAAISKDMALTVVFSDRDTVVQKNLSDSLFSSAPSLVKQFILIKSYPADSQSPEVIADHYWPQTKRAIFGGGPQTALHYYGAWKWLVAAAQDLQDGAKSTNSYLYGDQAADKGIANLTDDITRSW